MLTRPEFLGITGLRLDHFVTLGRSEQLPFNQTGEGRKLGHYSEYEAYLTLLALRLADRSDGFGIGRSIAASIIARAAPSIASRWPDVVAAANDPSKPRILVGALAPVGKPQVAVCGTREEILAFTDSCADFGLIVLPAPFALSEMRHRAEREKVTLDARFLGILSEPASPGPYAPARVTGRAKGSSKVIGQLSTRRSKA